MRGMRWVAVFGLFLGALAFGAPAEAVTGKTVDDACYATIGGAPQIGVRTCRGGEQLKRDGADMCRYGGLTDTCGLIDGRYVGPAHMTAYERSWVHRALRLQRGLDDDVALHRALLPHTHNSFNSGAYAPPTVTNLDPNQVYSITDQLRMDMRAIEMDVHWVPSVYGNAATNYKAVTLCHGQTQAGVHLGCSADRPLRYGLRELKSWLEQPTNRREFVLLYLENNLDDEPVAHNLVASELQRVLGDLVARPPANKPCAPIDTSVTPASLRAKGHRVLIVGNCGPGAWGSWVYERGDAKTWFESSSPQGDDYPGLGGGLAPCAKERARHKAGSALVRWYEDGTWLSATVGNTRSQLTAREATAMANCGVNLIGFDELTPEDPRLAAIVWSWARNEPAAPTGNRRCATSGTDGRFHAGSCEGVHPFACTDGSGHFVTSRNQGRFADGDRVCGAATRGWRFGVPRNGWENQQVRDGASGQTTWLNYTDAGNGSWLAN